jgi:hypothetical protein
MYITNTALYYVPYTIKIVVKSSRVLPVMAFSMALQGTRYSACKLISALTLVTGVGLFLAGDALEMTYPSLNYPGILLLVASLAMDALLSNLEEKHFFRTPQPTARVEVIANLSLFGSFFSVLALAISGAPVCLLDEFPNQIHFSRPADAGTVLHRLWLEVCHCHAGELTREPKDALIAASAWEWVVITSSAIAGYGSMSFMLLLIDSYGVVTTEAIKTIRKVLQVRPKTIATRWACSS